MEKTAAAKHSADYRRRQKEEKEKLGIETLEIDAPVGTRSGMSVAMKDHDYKGIRKILLLKDFPNPESQIDGCVDRAC